MRRACQWSEKGVEGGGSEEGRSWSPPLEVAFRYESFRLLPVEVFERFPVGREEGGDHPAHTTGLVDAYEVRLLQRELGRCHGLEAASR